MIVPGAQAVFVSSLLVVADSVPYDPAVLGGYECVVASGEVFQWGLPLGRHVATLHPMLAPGSSWFFEVHYVPPRRGAAGSS